MAAHVMTHMTDIEIGTLLHGISPLIPLQGRETSIGTLLTATHLTTLLHVMREIAMIIHVGLGGALWRGGMERKSQIWRLWLSTDNRSKLLKNIPGQFCARPLRNGN